MIYTITANPAIDYHMDLTVQGFYPGQINRSQKEEMFPGGKGLNVSVVLSELGIENIAWGFAAGKTGTLLESLAREKGCICDFIRIPEGETRINVKLDCDRETAVNGSGPRIGEEQAAELLARVQKLTGDDLLILSGNLQAGSINLYEAVCRIAQSRKTRVIVDTEGDTLKKTFAYHPFLIKPNEEELLALYDAEDGSIPSLVSLMMKCREEGAENVLVTLGGKGALFLSLSGGLYHAQIREEQPVISTVGAGDSTIAGFLAGLSRCGECFEDVLRLACAAGTATACKKWLCTAAEAEAMLPYISVGRLQSAGEVV